MYSYKIYLQGNIFLAIYDEFVGQWETEIYTHAYFMDVWVYISFQFIKPQNFRKWLEKCYPKDKSNKSTCRICLIYFIMAPFNDNIKFRLRNLNINDLIFLHLHNSVITKRFFLSFDRHRDKTVTFSKRLLNINNFSSKIVDVIRKFHEFSFNIVRVITIVVSNPVNFLVNARLWRQSIASGYSMTSRFAAILLLS